MFSTVTIRHMIAIRLIKKLCSWTKKTSSTMASFIAVELNMTGSTNMAAVSIKAGSVSASSDAALTSSSGDVGIVASPDSWPCPGFIFKIRKLVVRNRQIIDLNIRASSEAQTNFFEAF